MTAEQARLALSQRPKHMRTHSWLKSELRYERHVGIHTYHPCECDRGNCRTNRCAECLEEMLAVAKE